MRESFLTKEAIEGGRKIRKRFLILLIFYICMVGIIAFATKGSMDFTDYKTKKIIVIFILLTAFLLFSIILGLIKSFVATKKGKNLKLLFEESSKEAVADLIDKEAAEGKLLVNEYIYDFSDGKKPYGEKVILTPTYLLLGNGTGLFKVIPRDKIYWLCAQPGIKGRSSYIVRLLVFTEKGTFSLDGTEVAYLENLADKLYAYIPNVFHGQDTFVLSYQLEELYRKNKEEFLRLYEMAKQGVL